jgi:hypothetical protein
MASAVPQIAAKPKPPQTPFFLFRQGMTSVVPQNAL